MLLITWIITFVLPLAEGADTPASSLRGSLVFEQLAHRPITVNPHYFNFYRQFNLSHIVSALDLLDEYNKLYAKLCNNIHQLPNFKSTIYKQDVNYRNNSYYFHWDCISRGAQLPEIRTQSEKEHMTQFMIDNDFRIIPAGIVSGQNVLRYISDKTVISNIVDIKNCQGCPTLENINMYDYMNSTDNTKSIFVNYSGPGIMPYYMLNPDRSMILVPMNRYYKNSIICVRPLEKGITTLHIMLRNTCLRDTSEITEHNRLLREEVLHFLYPSNPLYLNIKNMHNRLKRAAIPIITLSLLGGAISKQSPLDALGSLGSSIFGLATRQDMIITKDKLNEHATQINALAINQELIVQAINEVHEHIQNISKYQQIASHQLTQVYAETDNKGMIRHLQNLIQLSLLKMQTAINAATQSLPSPYVFSSKDLQNITQAFRMNDIMLTTNLNEISASVMVAEDEYTFLFNVPVHDDRNKFNFFEVKQLPIFKDNKTYRAQITNKYIGINVNTNEYLLLSETEFQRCLILPICMLPNPFIRITENSPCEINTFKDYYQRCPLEEIQYSTPYFLNYKNTTIFSTPKSIQIHITCKSGYETQSTYKSINGMGSFEVNPGCIIHVPPDTNIRPEYMMGQLLLSGSSILDGYKNHSTDLVIIPPPLNISTTTFKPLTITNVKSLRQAVDLIFNHEQTFTEVIRVIAYIAMALFLIWSLTFCFPKFRLWLKSFCLITKPEKYWGMRKYVIPSPYIRQSSAKTDPLESYIQSFRQRLAKIINQPSHGQPNNDDHIKANDSSIVNLDVVLPQNVNQQQANLTTFRPY